MKLPINPFTVGLTSSAIAFMTEPAFRHNGAEGVLGGIGTGVAAGLSYFLGSFIPHKMAARHFKRAQILKSVSQGLNVIDQIDAHNAAVPHLKRGVGFTLLGAALGITATVVGYKQTKPEIMKRIAPPTETAISFRSNFTPNDNAVSYYVSTPVPSL